MQKTILILGALTQAQAVELKTSALTELEAGCEAEQYSWWS